MRVDLFQCIVINDKNKKIRGPCKARITSHFGEQKSFVILQVARSEACLCGSKEETNWGLRDSLKRKVDDLVSNASHLQPNEVHIKVMKGLSDDEIEKSTNSDIRRITKNQIIRRVKHQKKVMGKTETLGNGVKYVADLVAIREHYTFGTPEKCNKNLSSESQVQQYGCDLHDKKLLKVIATEDTPHPRREAYRLMTILSPEIDASDDGVSEPEKNLLKRINYLKEKKKNSTKKKVTCCIQPQCFLLWHCFGISFVVVISNGE